MPDTYTADDVSNEPVKADELPESVTHVADDIDNQPDPNAPKDAGPFKAVADWVPSAADSKSVEDKKVAPKASARKKQD